MARLDYENWVTVPQNEIAEALDLKRPNVSASIKLLEKKQIILRGPKVGRSSSWRLNPNYGFKGNPVGKVKRHSTKGHLYLAGGTDADQLDIEDVIAANRSKPTM
jgi:hypothetical protein